MFVSAHVRVYVCIIALSVRMFANLCMNKALTEAGYKETEKQGCNYINMTSFANECSTKENDRSYIMVVYIQLVVSRLWPRTDFCSRKHAAEQQYDEHCCWGISFGVLVLCVFPSIMRK